VIFGENPHSDRLRVAVFASGNGSNFQSILNAIASGFLKKTDVVLLVSNNSGAGAIQKARNHHIPAVHISRKHYASDEEVTEAILTLLEHHGVNFIALAGYMKKLGARIVKRFRNRIVNIHPALLPSFGGKGMYGMHVHEAVIQSGAMESGATVHLVDEDYDRGPIVLQQKVAVEKNDTAESLAARVLETEHDLYPRALALFENNQIRVVDGNLRIVGKQ
jgi:phosphoribosylglycinamide formyltransferase-1